MRLNKELMGKSIMFQIIKKDKTNIEQAKKYVKEVMSP